VSIFTPTPIEASLLFCHQELVDDAMYCKDIGYKIVSLLKKQNNASIGVGVYFKIYLSPKNLATVNAFVLSHSKRGSPLSTGT